MYQKVDLGTPASKKFNFVSRVAISFNCSGLFFLRDVIIVPFISARSFIKWGCSRQRLSLQECNDGTSSSVVSKLVKSLISSVRNAFKIETNVEIEVDCAMRALCRLSKFWLLESLSSIISSIFYIIVGGLGKAACTVFFPRIHSFTDVSTEPDSEKYFAD